MRTGHGLQTDSDSKRHREAECNAGRRDDTGNRSLLATIRALEAAR